MLSQNGSVPVKPTLIMPSNYFISRSSVPTEGDSSPIHAYDLTNQRLLLAAWFPKTTATAVKGGGGSSQGNEPRMWENYCACLTRTPGPQHKSNSIRQSLFAISVRMVARRVTARYHRVCAPGPHAAFLMSSHAYVTARKRIRSQPDVYKGQT